jgi:hypothetical protein
MSTKTKPDGGALPLILEKWISNIQTRVMLDNRRALILKVLSSGKYTRLSTASRAW